MCGLLCGSKTFEEIEVFAICREKWLRQFLKLPNGIPSHDTIYRVFCALDQKVVVECLASWMNDLTESLGMKHVAIDGKSLRGATGNTFCGCVHLVNAWATEQGLILGQEPVEEGSSEATAIPALLESLHLKGVLVTIDAIGCQKEIVNQIRQKGGEYLLTVKGNQPKLLKSVEKIFDEALESDFANVQSNQFESVDDRHGRHEERYVTVIEDPNGLPEGWKDVGCVVQVIREREVKGVNSSTTHFYISSFKGKASQMAGLIRRHWAIENELHWSLDVSFAEDANRVADRNASANLAIVRRLAISLLKQEPKKHGLRSKAFLASLDTDYLSKLLQGNMVF